MGREGGHEGRGLQRGVPGAAGESWGTRASHARGAGVRCSNSPLTEVQSCSWAVRPASPPSDWVEWTLSPSGNEMWMLAVGAPAVWAGQSCRGPHCRPSSLHCSGQLGPDLPGPGLLPAPTPLPAWLFPHQPSSEPALGFLPRPSLECPA